MLESVYIESSVISYLTARPSRDVVITARQAITSGWWHNHRTEFELFISALVIKEISKGDEYAAQQRLDATEGLPLLQTSDQALSVAEELIAQGAVPVNSEEDALHIGLAASAGIDYLLTWNFKHINNAQTKKKIVSVVETYGFTCPILCSPEELGEEI
ncbi:MAG: hypothetical protein D3906_14770 [Candidatus Electrothrix sp. AUS1_2]|nr:hypothetical protein [Candidatus Electrothrix sp. AUS1_2]